jgi:hypothetical protein
MISAEQNSFITALFLCNLMIESTDNFSTLSASAAG